MSTSKDEPDSHDRDVESTAERRHGFLGLGGHKNAAPDDAGATTSGGTGATAAGSTDDTAGPGAAETARHGTGDAERTSVLHTHETIGGDTRAAPGGTLGQDDTRAMPAAARQEDETRVHEAGGDAHRDVPRRDAGSRHDPAPRDHGTADDLFGGPRDGAVLAGATQARPRSRGGAHVLSLIVCLLLVPVAWYLLADGGARLTLGDDAAWESGRVNAAAVLELVAGLVVAAVVVLSARWSSLGVTVTGIIVLIAGLAFVVVPRLVRDLLDPVLEGLRSFNDLGANAAAHLVADGTTGRLALYGLVLLLLGVVSHGARRLGRDEERARAAYARGTGTEA